MEFKKLLNLYEQKKKAQKGESFAFVGDMFKEIEKNFKLDAEKRGKNPQQAWNSWSGKKLEDLLKYIIASYIEGKYKWIGITSDGKLRSKKLSSALDRIKRNVIIFYGKYGVVPDADIVIYDKRDNSVIVVLSIKASLRERVAQAAYWKLKLLSSKNTQKILYFLVSTDNDHDFDIVNEERSRDRIIVEFGELDGAWILNEIQEGDKVKKFEHIFDDLDKIFNLYKSEQKKNTT